MGSEFIDRHRKKTVWAALLLLFRGRAKYVAALLLVVAFSIPFVVSSETLGRMLAFPPVASALRLAGLGGLVDSLNPAYSRDLVKETLDKALADSRENSLWAKIFGGGQPSGSGSQASGLAMLRGGIYAEADAKAAPNKVKGAVDKESGADGQGADAVDLGSMMPPDGIPGSMADAMAGSFGSGSPRPFMGRSFGAGGVIDSRGSSAMYNSAVRTASERVPQEVKGRPDKAKLGRVSGFSWKNVGYSKSRVAMGKGSGNKRSMFQLAETFSMGWSAKKSKDAAPEYQASYVGATFDGNDVNGDVISTDAEPVAGVPDTGYTGSLMNTVGGMSQTAQECSEANGSHGSAMGEVSDRMDTILRGMGSPPKCCSSRVKSWNAKVDEVVRLCGAPDGSTPGSFNYHLAELNKACKSNTTEVCRQDNYRKMHIKPCSKLKCFLAFLLLLLGLIILSPLLLTAAVLAMTGIISFDMKKFKEKIGQMQSWLASGGDGQG